MGLDTYIKKINRNDLDTLDYFRNNVDFIQFYYSFLINNLPHYYNLISDVMIPGDILPMFIRELKQTEFNIFPENKKPTVELFERIAKDLDSDYSSDDDVMVTDYNIIITTI